MVKVRRTTWVDRVPAGLLERLRAEVDCGHESMNAIYARWNMVRYCQPRTFRLWAGQRRARIHEYEVKSGRVASRAAWNKYQQELAGRNTEQAGGEQQQRTAAESSP